MTQFFRKIAVMVLTVVWTGHACLATPASSTSGKRLGPIHIEEYGVYNAVAEISIKAKIATGFDAIQPTKEPYLTLDFSGGTVADLLNLLTSKAPDYAWEETSDGVIQIFRQGAQVSLLDVTLSYPGADHKTRLEIWKDLANRPEISNWLQASGCSREEIFTGKQFRGDNAPISIAPGAMTIRQLFDEVALKSGHNRWSILQSPLSGEGCRVDLMLW